MSSAPTNTPPSAADEAVQSRDLEPIEAEEEGIEGDHPVLEAIDTSGVSRTPLPTPPMEADPLFGQDAATDYRARWDVVQRSFVDDPPQAVRQGDELVTQVIDSLRDTFAAQRTDFERSTDRDQDSTETLRLALRRYRAFFERLLTI
jgi:hypothetical protein